ncbi:MAG: hypothetical protein ACLQIB_16220 [Isosphaeraceae bacterium]
MPRENPSIIPSRDEPSRRRSSIGQSQCDSSSRADGRAVVSRESQSFDPIGVKSAIHREGAKSAKEYGDPAHQSLTMRRGKKGVVSPLELPEALAAFAASRNPSHRHGYLL